MLNAGRKTARDTVVFPYLCPQCNKSIFKDGIIRMLTCPECKCLLMLVHGELKPWVSASDSKCDSCNDYCSDFNCSQR